MRGSTSAGAGEAGPRGRSGALDRERKLTETSASQSGLFTFQQAVGCGFPPATIHDRTVSGAWEQWAYQVYGRAGLPRTWRRRLLALVLAAGPGAAAARNSAAVLWDLPTGRRHPLEVVVPYDRCVRIATDGSVPHRSRTLVPEDILVINGIPATVVDRTIIDLAGERTVEQLSEMMAHAIRRGQTDAEGLTVRQDRAGRVRGAGRYRRARARLDPETDRSRAVREVRLVRALVDEGLPRPVIGYREVDPSGTVIAEIDVAYVPQKVAIEVDGYIWHSSPWQKRYDSDRQNRLVLRGWTVLRFTSEDIDQRLGWVVRQVAEALATAQP